MSNSDELKELEPKNIKSANEKSESSENKTNERTIEQKVSDLEKDNKELNKRLIELEKGSFKPGQTRHLKENEFVSLHQNLDSLTKDT
jgi:hypothetical protein